jgi:hypothetical protein
VHSTSFKCGLYIAATASRSSLCAERVTRMSKVEERENIFFITRDRFLFRQLFVQRDCFDMGKHELAGFQA